MNRTNLLVSPSKGVLVALLDLTFNAPLANRDADRMRTHPTTTPCPNPPQTAVCLKTVTVGTCRTRPDSNENNKSQPRRNP